VKLNKNGENTRPHPPPYLILRILHICVFFFKKKAPNLETSVVDPKLFVPDPDPTFQRVTDPDPTFKKVPDPVSDPTLNIYFFSRTIILRSFNSILKHNSEEYLKFVSYNGKN
jgi:hypothetical protein